MQLAILLVEDNPRDARLVQEYFKEMDREQLFDRHGYSLEYSDIRLDHVDTLTEATDRLEENSYDLVFLDLRLPDYEGLETVSTVTAAASTVPVVVLTGMPEEEMGVLAVAEGAQDYLVKDELTPRRLLKTVQYAIERKEVEQELRRQSEQLTFLNRLTRHDIRNDVSLIVGRGQELRDLVDSRGQERLEEIIQAGHHVLRLTESIGDALDMITAPESRSLSAAELRPVLETEVKAASDMYRGAEITMGEIPDVEVRGNRLLSSMFGNLINNCVLYNDKATPHVHIEVTVHEDTVEVTIADNGPGIPRQQQEVLFEEGSQGPESTGLGIGLTLVSRLVNVFGGSIAITDNEPEGSVFVIELERVG